MLHAHKKKRARDGRAFKGAALDTLAIAVIGIPLEYNFLHRKPVTEPGDADEPSCLAEPILRLTCTHTHELLMELLD